MIAMERNQPFEQHQARLFFLYGPPGSGKSAVGKQLARNLGINFVDLDTEIEEQTQRQIPEIFAKDGEAAFRQLELEVLSDICKNDSQVIALGGGALISPGTMSLAQSSGRIICLNSRLESLIQRLQNDPIQRPLLADDLPTRLSDLLERRKNHYASFPLQVDTTDLTPAEGAHECQILLGEFRVSGMGSDYDVVIRMGGLAQLGKATSDRGLKGPIALTSEQRVAALYLNQANEALQELGYISHPVVFPAGEEAKNIETVMNLWSSYLEMGLERGSTVVALGGGVTTDIGGFAAATYQRGVRWVSVPTSLLGMVDAGIGGKTGIDLPQGKNLAGAFHAPAYVLIDPSVLATLPEIEIRNGMGEVVKAGIIGDPQLFSQVSQGLPCTPPAWFQLVSRSVGVKVRIICEDPFEKGQRAALNLGHSIGHGIEKASNYSLRHGEAVAIGTVLEARLSENLGLARNGLADHIAETFRNLDLPTSIPSSINREEIIEAMTFDKKKAGGKVRFALPVRIGEVKVGVQVENEQLLSVII